MWETAKSRGEATMTKIRSLAGATPRLILGNLIEEVDDIESVIFFYKKKDGEITGAASDSCELSDVSYFTSLLQMYFHELVSDD